MGYNYESFSADQYDLVKPGGPGLGEKAPDFEMTTLDGTPAQLLDFDGDFLVIEVGSITCPLFQSRRAGMANAVAKFPNADFVVFYVREAHPGAEVGQHKSLEDKVSCASQLRNLKEGRRVLIDGLEGEAHTAYGSYPNAVFIINRAGCVLFRADWNDPAATTRALALLSAGKPAKVFSFFKPPKPPVAIRTFKQSGKGSAADFFKSLPTLFWQNLILRNVRMLLGMQKAVGPDATC